MLIGVLIIIGEALFVFACVTDKSKPKIQFLASLVSLTVFALGVVISYRALIADTAIIFDLGNLWGVLFCAFGALANLLVAIPSGWNLLMRMRRRHFCFAV